MEALVNLITAAILSLSAVRGPHNGEDLERSVVIAQDIANAVQSAKTLPVSGDAAKEGSALALVAIAWHESGFREDIQTCRACDGKSALCDRGKSVTMYQMKKHAWQGHTRVEVCADNELATSLALGVLARHHTSMDGVFRAYATGSAAVRSTAGAELNAIFERLTRKFKFKVMHKGVLTEVSFTPASKMARESSALAERLRYSQHGRRGDHEGFAQQLRRRRQRWFLREAVLRPRDDGPWRRPRDAEGRLFGRCSRLVASEPRGTLVGRSSVGEGVGGRRRGRHAQAARGAGEREPELMEHRTGYIRVDGGIPRVPNGYSPQGSGGIRPKGPAGYDLFGIGGEVIGSAPNMQARGVRQERILTTHEGWDMKASDYKWGDTEQGFRWRVNFGGV